MGQYRSKVKLTTRQLTQLAEDLRSTGVCGVLVLPGADGYCIWSSSCAAWARDRHGREHVLVVWPHVPARPPHPDLTDADSSPRVDLTSEADISDW